MAKTNLEKEIARVKANGAKTSKKGWTGAVRSLEDPTFNIGDEIKFPKEWKPEMVFEGAFGQFCLVETKAGAVKQWFPGTATKRREICEKDENGFVVGTGNFAENDGTMITLYRTEAETDKAMDLLCDKTIRITDKRTENVADWNDSTRLRKAVFYTIDLVEDAK